MQNCCNLCSGRILTVDGVTPGEAGSVAAPGPTGYKIHPLMQSNRELNIEGIGLDVETLPRPLVWRQVFGNEHPVELEIGTGKGTFLTEQAKARPDVNFFGLE